MKVTIETIPSLQELEVLIRCAKTDDEVRALLSYLSLREDRLMAQVDDEIHPLNCRDVLYIESIDRKTFAYTETQVLELNYRLYELLERLQGRGFEQASKNCLINLCKVEYFKSCGNGKLLASLNNGEQIVISRAYAKEIKQRLGAYSTKK